MRRRDFQDFGGPVAWAIFDRNGNLTVWGDIHCLLRSGRNGTQSIEFSLADGHTRPVNPRLSFEIAPDTFTEVEEGAMLDRMLQLYLQAIRSIQP